MTTSVAVYMVGSDCLTVTGVFKHCVVAKNAGVRVIDFRSGVVKALSSGAPAVEVVNAMRNLAMMTYDRQTSTIRLYDVVDGTRPEKALWIGNVSEFNADEILSQADGRGAALA